MFRKKTEKTTFFWGGSWENLIAHRFGPTRDHFVYPVHHPGEFFCSVALWGQGADESESV